nr:MAG TPA: Cyclin-dependent kinase 9 [Caudoviricetes sp.]
MGRLIDAGLILDNLSGRLESMKDYDAVKDVINNMPTAYDPDKVVERLEDYLFEKYCVEGDAEIERIVKGGGVDGN